MLKWREEVIFVFVERELGLEYFISWRGFESREGSLFLGL